MPEIIYTDGERTDQIAAVKTIIGVCLIIAGVLVYSWVFLSVYRIFTDPQNLVSFKQILPAGEEAATIEIDNDDIVIPQGIMNFMAYLVAIFLMLIAAKIGGEILSKGMYLFQSSQPARKIK